MDIEEEKADNEGLTNDDNLLSKTGTETKTENSEKIDVENYFFQSEFDFLEEDAVVKESAVATTGTVVTVTKQVSGVVVAVTVSRGRSEQPHNSLDLFIYLHVRAKRAHSNFVYVEFVRETHE